MWYKRAFEIKNFFDRNIANAQIRALQDLSSLLVYCSALVFQTQRGARGVVAQIKDHKKISSFPEVVDILAKADKIALDSPSRFADLCKEAAMEIDRKAQKLIKAREEFARIKKKSKKGLF